MDNFIDLSFITNVVGTCGSGKSYLIKYMLRSMRRSFNFVVVFSNTAGFTKDYEFLNEIGMPHAIHSSLNIETITAKVMEIQKKNRLQNRLRNVLIIFDDCFGNVGNSKIFKNLVSTYRHYNISIIFSTQYVSGATTFLREISNYVVIFNQRTQNALRLTYENYFAADYENFNEFKQHFKNSLLDYHFYFIDRIKNTKQIMVCPSKKN